MSSAYSTCKYQSSRGRVESVTQFKYVGLILDCHFNFDKHVDHVVEKSTTKLGMLYKTRWLFDFQTAKMLYCTLITPYFDLGNRVYIVAAQYHLNRLQVTQNTAARIILLCDDRCPTYKLHERLQWDTLATQATKALVRIIYSCVHNKSPTSLYSALTPVRIRSNGST